MLNEQKYISIGTRKRDGSWVWTPVWFASAGDQGGYYLFSAGNAGKVKRIRNYPQVQLAPCSAFGRILGASMNGAAWLEYGESESIKAYAALSAKYGWQMALLDFFSKLSGNLKARQLIGFSLVGDQG
jgi:hypothetical protein